jgi:hypothetical protein
MFGIGSLMKINKTKGPDGKEITGATIYICMNLILTAINMFSIIPTFSSEITKAFAAVA